MARGTNPVNDIRRNTLVWMALAFSASLGLAISIIAAFGINPGLSIALRSTARLAFLIFLPAYFDKVTLELKPFRALRGVQPTAVFSLSQLLARSEYTALQKLRIMRISPIS